MPNEPKVIGSLLAVLGLVAVGVGVGVTVSKNHKSSSNASSSSSSAVQQTDPNDPSTFKLDTRLKKSFWGIAYTPEGSQYPDCGNSLGTLPGHACPCRARLTTFQTK